MACGVFPAVSNNGISTNTPDIARVGNALNVWQQAAPGVELRYEYWKSPSPSGDTVVITRFDLHRIHLKVEYQPAQPMMLSKWLAQEHAIAAINGGYFDAQNNATALVISDGRAYGTSYDGFGGMLAVDAQGNVNLRSLHQQAYDANNEQLQQATQSAPLLVLNGKRTQFSANAASQRRSIVAMDKQGRLLLIVSPLAAFTLDELADLLVSSDLSIDTALNLDGGSSTGLYLKAGKQYVTIDSLTALPLVIVLE
ncbi:MAG: phosphodiester glycosidase family protein [Ktedonobacteraceae bacterium]|nr:phosphodiester glycosidase family protein [Ktedonobacteraceae bacterium]